jgi:ubiquinone biosynthesis protein
MTVAGGPMVFGISAFTLLGLFGYMIAFVNSIWILYGIWRSGKD